MKAISLWQPWALLIFHGKDVENRKWPSHYTGPLLIHSAKKWDYEGHLWVKKHFPALWCKMPHKDNFVFGALLGKVKLIDCVSFCDSPWFQGPWGHIYRDPKLFNLPIPYRGQQGFFNVPGEEILNAL